MSVGVPVQVPLPAVSVRVSWGVPEIVGRPVLTGAVGATTPVWALVAYWRVRRGNLAEVAEGYALQVEAVQAALGGVQRRRLPAQGEPR